MEKPNLSKQAFWDVDFDTIDYQKYQNWVIEKVFQFGSLSDLKEVIRFYGEENCKKALINAHFLRLNAISIGHLLFDIPKKQFKCYKNRPLHLPF